MFELKDPIVTNVLHSLNQHGESAIFGGYIRDILLNINPKDIDIATTLSTEQVISIYPMANIRETISGYTIVSFTIKGRVFEIVPNSEDLLKKASDADLNINSLTYDGNHLIDATDSLKDFEKKTISSVNNNFEELVATSPFIWLKPFRLSSTTGFIIDKELLDTLEKTKSTLNLINKSIKTQEGYKILNSKYPLLSLKFLSKIGLICPFEIKFDPKSIILPNSQNNYHLQLIVFAYATSTHTINDFLTLYEFPESIKNNFYTLMSLLSGETSTTNFRLLNQKLLLERLLQKK
ncbi:MULTISPECIES: CCA tRNA nucleotidyltransferase [Bacillus cereus group]|uniref:Poly A polymerase head domain-containing protein n=1 Tax=Bacillus thuringiensis TaxID=1428 RepID=A0A9X6WHS7_BACTU|nr:MULTISPECIES: CCA tRNA nucleotidyltransferase [Bacillus cereus group]PFJ31067.1 hypothetical protein COJ15_30510 [Bacillus thuringiensis]PGP11535.1 hypothetical protein COA01_35315 [Bacillus cereus]